MCARSSAGEAGALRALLEAGSQLRMAVSGSSMRPILRPGDYLVIRPLEGPPRVGEVVVYARGGRLWAHRLVARSPSGKFLLTKGDARGRPDAPVRPGELVGRAVAAERGGRRLSLEGLGSRLAGLAVSLSAPAAALGVRLARRAGMGGKKRRLSAGGFNLEIAAPPEVLRLAPGARRRTRGKPDFRLEIEIRGAPTAGGRYGLADAGRQRYTFTTPAVLARIDMSRRECRAALLPGMEHEGLASLLRIVSVLLVTGPGEGLTLHASAVRKDGRAYLFSGPGGAGKSTALERSVEAGGEPLADDLVLLRKEPGRWLVWGPPLEPGRRAGPTPREGTPLGALLVPGRGRGRARLDPLSPARWATLAAVFPPGAPLHQKMLDRLGDLAESAPAFRVSFADRPGALAALFATLESAE